MPSFFRAAKDTQPEVDATELRLRAERRLGLMLTEQKQKNGFARGGQPYQGSTGTDEEPVERIPTLAEVGIDKKLSSRAQRIGGIGEQAFVVCPRF